MLERSAPWDGTEAGYERDLCCWKPIGQIALSLCKGSHVTVPRPFGSQVLLRGDRLVKLPSGEIAVEAR